MDLIEKISWGTPHNMGPKNRFTIVRKLKNASKVSKLALQTIEKNTLIFNKFGLTASILV